MRFLSYSAAVLASMKAAAVLAVLTVAAASLLVSCSGGDGTLQNGNIRGEGRSSVESAAPNDEDPADEDAAGADPAGTDAGKNPERGPDGVLADPGIPPVEFHKKFDTDFGRSTVYFDSIISGGPEKDGIPSIDEPVFEDVQAASQWITANEPVLLLVHEGRTRVYPLQILMWHEIVNDSFGGNPVAVSYCPLTNTAIAYDTRLDDGSELTFGTTGRLRFSNLVMYDRQTETWWQQATGEGIVGRHAGDRLRMLPLAVLPWSEVREYYPDAEVLTRESGYEGWPYGRNPYEGYDSSDGPFLYIGPELDDDGGLIKRVLAVRTDEQIRGYTFERLREKRVITDRLSGRDIVLFWQAGTSSVLDTAAISAGRDVGTAQAYYPEADGRQLNFYRDGEKIRDRETGSEWSVSGLAVAGELEGTRLAPIVSLRHFGFSWQVFESEYSR